MLEVFTGTWGDGLYDKLNGEVPGRAPVRAGYPNGLGYTGSEGMYVARERVAAALHNEGVALKWYESYNDNGPCTGRVTTAQMCSKKYKQQSKN